MALTKNNKVNVWLDEVTALLKPDQVVLITGEQAQLDQLSAEAVSTGEFITLNQEKLPGCYLHRSDPTDVARVEDRTFICSVKEEDAGPTNNWMDPGSMKAKLMKLYDGAMQGRTMYVIPYSMSVVGSPFAKYGIEVTDSIYVVISMNIMTRVGMAVLEALGTDGDFIKGLHAKKDLDPQERYIVQFPEENTIMSINSGYGGNVLLGKKCFALRIASYLGRQENWMAEHMLILGIQNPQGEVRYVTAAFPSACGKTNLAMLIPPEGYLKKGYKVWCVGDDIAWLRVGEDGRLWAVNPENGFFGVAPGTSAKSNFNALESTKKNTLFTNVALDKSDMTVWWEGLNKTPPADAEDWQGRPWNGETSTEKGAHPNSRFTAPAKNCPCISPEFENPKGVPVSAIIFGGRRPRTAPLVTESFHWPHGVAMGSSMASEKTAAAEGTVGEIRRDPMAMLPFCGYHMADYWQHWLDMEGLLLNPPKIFTVNWFRTDEEGGFLWPGFGDNLRVLEWILNRCEGKAEAVESAVGWLPRPEDINLEGIEGVTEETMRELLYIDADLWKEEAAGIRAYYEQFGDKLPLPMLDSVKYMEARLDFPKFNAKKN